MGSETILFVGGHYEIKNAGSGQTVTKYYFAGTQRIAMRKYTIPQSMSVEYILGDHLGSTSITTDTTGAKVSEMRYKPWGEVRYSWTSGASTTPVYSLMDYTFTGQFSYMDDPSTMSVTEGFGLMFYNARMYDPALGRFTSADSIVPGGVQGYDRYAYVNNSPINYIDPSGHDASQCQSSYCSPIWQSTADVPLSENAQDLTDFADSVGMTPEEVIGIGLGHEMFDDTPDEQAIHMDVYRNGFLSYAKERCNGNPTYNCMLNYFSSAYQSVYGQFINSDGKRTNFWGKPDDYLWAQYKDSENMSNLGLGKQETVKLGIEFMIGNKSTGSFMDTISEFSYDSNLASNSGVVDAQALIKYLHGYPTSNQGFLVVKRATCPGTGAAGFALYYNLLGQQNLGDAGLKAC